jgi:hypothetical protein
MSQHEPSKMQTECRTEQMESLQCIQENYGNQKKACANYFEVYKECRKKEHQAILEANRKRAGWW